MEPAEIKKELQNFKFSNLNVRVLSYLALLMAFTAIATFIRIPGINTQYYNLGEVVIYTLAILFGKKLGAVVGGIGSALVDLIIAPIWAPFTLIIKGLEGWVVGSLAEAENFKRNLSAIFFGAHIMIIGYFLVVWLLYDWPAALTEIVGNYGQSLVGALIAIPISRQFSNFFRSD